MRVYWYTTSYDEDGDFISIHSGELIEKEFGFFFNTYIVREDSGRATKVSSIFYSKEDLDEYLESIFDFGY